MHKWKSSTKKKSQINKHNSHKKSNVQSTSTTAIINRTSTIVGQRKQKNKTSKTGNDTKFKQKHRDNLHQHKAWNKTNKTTNDTKIKIKQKNRDKLHQHKAWTKPAKQQTTPKSNSNKTSRQTSSTQSMKQNQQNHKRH